MQGKGMDVDGNGMQGNGMGRGGMERIGMGWVATGWDGSIRVDMHNLSYQSNQRKITQHVCCAAYYTVLSGGALMQGWVEE